MARLKSKARIKPLRIDAAVVREQLEQLALPRARFAHRPLHQLFTDAAAAAMRGDANVLDDAARRADGFRYNLRCVAGQSLARG